MQHPLVNPSLAPFGLVLPLRKERLKYRSFEGWPNPERLIAKCWDKANRLNAPRPRPVETIVHEILPGLAASNRHFNPDFEFDGKPYCSRDVIVLSSVVQWLATNVGNCFLTETRVEIKEDVRFHPEREFVLKLEYEDSRSLRYGYMGRVGLAIFLTHVCNEYCGAQAIRTLSGEYHVYRRSEVSNRDRALVLGLMHWLGRKDGRAFIASYLARRARHFDLARKRVLKETVLLPRTA
jgi:hypothetical protein